jgi:hypothetical protein
MEERILALEKLVAEQGKKIEKLEDENHDLKIALSAKGPETIEDKAPPKPTLPEEAVKVSGKEYKFRFAAFFFEGKRYLAEEAITDDKLLQKIAKSAGQSILKEVV